MNYNLHKRGDSMASCKFEGGKWKTKSEVKGHLRHNDITPERRKIAQKNNKDIDVTKSHLNKSILGLSYEEMCEKYDKRIEEIDRAGNKNRRKDRVTMQCIEVPVPKELARSRYDAWFGRVADILCDEYGEENFMDGKIHYDEEHEYIDPETKQKEMSRVHGHFMIVPEVDGQLNAKKISLRKNMKKLNQKVEAMTVAEFGCRFMTGKGTKSRKPVAQLKNESEALRLEQEAQAEKEKYEDLNKDLQKREKQVADDEEWIESVRNDLDVKKGYIGLLEDKAREKYAEAENSLKTANTKQDEADSVLDAVLDLRKQVQDEQKKQALEYLRRKKKLDEEKEAYKEELKAEADKQLQEYLQQQMERVSLLYRKSEGRPLPQGVKDLFGQMQDNFELDL